MNFSSCFSSFFFFLNAYFFYNSIIFSSFLNIDFIAAFLPLKSEKIYFIRVTLQCSRITIHAFFFLFILHSSDRKRATTIKKQRKNKIKLESTYLHQHQRIRCLGNNAHSLYNVFHSIIRHPKLAHFLRQNFHSAAYEEQ